jgi:endonuclease YncB( thermonuclease family)
MTEPLKAPIPAYVYKARFVRAIDGDTAEVDLDFGRFAGTQPRATIKVRLRGANTPERHEPGWAEARQFAIDVLTASADLVVKTYKSSFERTVADVWCDGHPLAELLIQAGHAQVDTRTLDEAIMAKRERSIGRP